MQRKKIFRNLGFIVTAGLAVLALSGVPTGTCPFCFMGVGTVQASNEKPESTSITIPVEGMTCASCTFTVRIAIKKLEGVIDAKVTLDPDQAAVTYDASKVGPQQIVDAINKAGYKARLPKSDEEDTSTTTNALSPAGDDSAQEE